MWVSPAWRGQGIGDLLVAQAIAWASDTPIRLWVVEDNQAARKLYERLGFQATGQYQPHPNDPAVRELRMVYGLTRPEVGSAPRGSAAGRPAS